MPTIFSGAISPDLANQGVLSPRVGPGAFASQQDTPDLPEDQQRVLTQRMFNTTYNENRGIPWYRGLAETVAGTGIDLTDTGFSSLYNATPMGMVQNMLGSEKPINRGDVWNLTGRYGGTIGTELQDYYTRNQSRIELMSGLTGAIATGYAAGELLLPYLADSLASSTAISSSRLWQAGARINASTRAAMEAGQAQAAMAGEAYSMWGGAGALQYRGLQIAKGVGKAAFEELAVAATTNTNQMVWSDDMSDNIFYSAIGLGIGGAVANYGARYEMRRLANDPVQVMRRRDAIDPQGFYAMMEHTPTARITGAEAKESAELTAQMLVARQVTQPNAAPELASRFETIRSQGLEQAGVSAQKISTKGATGIPGTRFNIEQVPGSAGAHFIEAAKADPLAHFGLDSVGIVRPREPTDPNAPLFQAFETREKTTEGLRKTQIPANIREARRLEQQQALYLVGNQWMPAKTPEAYSLSNYIPDNVELKPTAKGVNEFTFATDTGRNVRINSDFSPKIGIGGKVKLQHLPIHDFLQITQDGMTALMKRMKATGEVHVVPANPDWFQLDSAIEFEKRGGQVEWHKTGDLVNAEGARLASLRLKYLEVGNQPIGSVWQRLVYNLPLPNAAERIYDGTGDSIRTVLYGAAQGNDLTQLQSLRKAVMQTSGFDTMEGKVALDGDMFNFNRTPNGKWQQPVLGFFDNSKVSTPLNPVIVAQANAEIKASRINTLVANAQPGELVPNMTRAVITTPEFQRSRSISHLADDQVTGLGSKRSQLAGEFLTREFKDRDSQTLLDTMKIRTAVNQYVDQHIHALTKPLAEIQAKLTAATAMSSKTLVNQFFSNASGWDLEAAVPHGNFVGFQLAQTGRNAARLGRAVNKGELLVNARTGAEMVVDQLGLDFINAFNDVAGRILKDNNRLRVARGLSEIQGKKFYVPPPDTRNAHIGWTFDEEGQMVPGGAIVHKDAATFERLRSDKIKNLPAGWTFKTREAIPSTADEYDRAAMDWIDPGVGYAPAKGQAGTLASDTVNPNAVGDTLQWIRRQVEQIGTNQMRVLYDSQLGIARARGNVEAIVKGVEAAKNTTRNIWHEYQAIVLGQNLADSNNSITGGFMKAGEKIINGQIENFWPAVSWMAPSHINQWIGDAASRMGVRNPGSTLRAKSFDELATKLGPYSPYQSAADYAEQTFKVNRPPEIREITQKLGRLSSALVLRYMELPMAAMNMLGIITTLPSILRSGKAPVTSYFQVGNNTRVGVIDTMKILTGAIKDHMDPARSADWARMVRDGNTTQQVADFNKQLSLVQDRSTFNRVFFGDKTRDMKNITKVRGVQDVKDIVANKGIDGLISIATDTTENWSRSWAHFAGLRLADAHGIIGMDARHGFAQEIANAAIANYNPLNRPEFYQSAFGSMVGLFMSYMQSYNQRLFRWMETGNYKAIGSQLLMQSSLFGVASLPGFNMVQAGLMHAGVLKAEGNEDATLMDHIYAKLGPEVGSAFAHGGLSQLGVALYTRGDMNYRDVTLDPSRLMAGVGIMSSVASAVHEAAQSLFQRGTDPQSLETNDRLMEILARNMPNRVLKGILTQVANGGLDTDARGQIITENKNFFEAALRMFGVRSTRQQGAIEAFYANKQLMQREAARMDELRLQTRSLIRTDPNWQSNLMGVFNKYLEGGGRPEHFRTWIKDQIQASTRTRDVNDLVKALKHPENQMQVWRYGAYDGGN